MALREHKFFNPAVGAGLAVLAGLALWVMPLGEGWVNASYDYLFQFAAGGASNGVVLIQMDTESYDHYGFLRKNPWPRSLHAELLNRLADDGCSLVVMDTYFGRPSDPDDDKALVEALKRQKRVALMAKQSSPDEVRHGEPNAPGWEIAKALRPMEPFLSAARTNWGVACFDKDPDFVARRHWPFSVSAPYPSLAWTAARLAGRNLSSEPQEQWLRYYAPNLAWDSLSYCLATNQAKKYFENKIVFIGVKPENTVPGEADDKFSTPYTRLTGEAVGGVEILATAFLNLVNGDWLRRPAGWVEILVLMVSGTLLGGGLSRVPPLAAFGLAAGIALLVTLGAAWFSQKTNFWFPWLMIAGGQVPCALAWAIAGPKVYMARQAEATTVATSPGELQLEQARVNLGPGMDTPDAPDYEIFKPAFGEGSFGRVWLVRNSIHQWQALKAVYQSNFGPNSDAYEREFSGIEKYKPVSDKHPALLRVDFVSMKKPEGYFYYVMELGDALTPGWEQNPCSYIPKDLAKVRSQADSRRLPVQECVRIGLSLTAGLDFLHRQGLTHRDVKPQNIIFVKGEPKLADVGLVAEIRAPGEQPTSRGTPGYMPPEPPGAPAADIYGLGMVLYVILTGRNPGLFPELATTLLEKGNPAEFMRLNSLILKACHPDAAQRFASAAEMAAALREVQKALECEVPTV